MDDPAAVDAGEIDHPALNPDLLHVYDDVMTVTTSDPPEPGLVMVLQIAVVRVRGRHKCPRCGHRRKLYQLAAFGVVALAGRGEMRCASCALMSVDAGPPRPRHVRRLERQFIEAASDNGSTPTAVATEDPALVRIAELEGELAECQRELRRRTDEPELP